MKTKQMTVAAMLGLFFILPFVLSTNLAAPANAEETGTTVVLVVNENGFSGSKGQDLSHQVIKVPKESNVKVVFEYADQSGDYHEFGMLLPSDEEIYSESLSKKNRRTEIEFYSGKAGMHYEVYCILSCAAMDNLTDLVFLSI